MTDRLVEVIQELRDYLGLEAEGLTDEDVRTIEVTKKMNQGQMVCCVLVIFDMGTA